MTKVAVPRSLPILGLDPSARYCGIVTGSGPAGYYTKKEPSNRSGGYSTVQFAWSVENFRLADWTCLGVPAHRLHKLQPEALPYFAAEVADWCQESWEKHYPTMPPRVAIEWSYMGGNSAGALIYLQTVAMIYQRLFEWTNGNIIRVHPATHQQFLYRYAGVRLFEKPKIRKKTKAEEPERTGNKTGSKTQTQELVQSLYEMWPRSGDYPVQLRDRWSRFAHVKATKQQHEAVADAVSVALAGITKWDEIMKAAKEKMR